MEIDLDNYNLGNNKCVLVNTEEEFKILYPNMRSAQNGIKYDDQSNKPYRYPIYIEEANSVTTGRSYGWGITNINTWTGKPMEVLTINDL